ncbi:MAG TPA: response regulator, partial [Elusimicrobiales bacterium]|nr:response regulator [Elusimicrobiales bacterium]
TLLETAFRDEYQVFTATDGQAALDALKKEQPDLILLDIDMPGMNGLEALGLLRATNKNVCVVMLTSTEKLDIAKQALELGANEYVTKPFDLAQLRNIVAAKLNKGEDVVPWKVYDEGAAGPNDVPPENQAS